MTIFRIRQAVCRATVVGRLPLWEQILLQVYFDGKLKSAQAYLIQPT